MQSRAVRSWPRRRIMPRIETDPDPARLAALDAACFPDAWDAAAYARLRANPAVTAWLLRADDGAAAGLLACQCVGDEAELYRIGVLPARRGQGLGGWLLRRWLEHAAQAGVRRVHLEVREGNAAARRLYDRAGFVAAGRRSGYYTAPTEDALHYVWKAEAPSAGA
jgi:[ribosomal protein S18]-alanine N-acetyltransferase